MREDALIDARAYTLRDQFHALLMRLLILQGQQQAHGALNACALQRFERLLKQCFITWHQVAECQPIRLYRKSLTRTTVAAVGIRVKAFISARINLEVKQLLVYADLPVAAIAEKRGAGGTPAEFQQQ